ncbi:MAG TPA: Vms1/Ankzf1 family peptidyl-tRNA hydrolase [Herpetosiphonaceae bacterium]|nr:Vms1/Ankzf1 family peptidyl-tRNA hydrolase [Herpetosiphonaceae bacterium]
MSTDLMGTLQALTAQPSTEHPYLSVYLDWSPDGNGNRQSLQALEQELDFIAGRLKECGADLQSFETDRQRITDYVTTEAPDDARGIAIFACDAESIWEPLPLQVPVETRIVEDRYPHTFNLARIIDDFETYAVVLADSQESRIVVISLNEAEQVGTTEADEDVKRFQAGGWAQMIFQRRTENVIKAHTKDIADKLGRIIKRFDVQHVIIAGNDSIKGTVMGVLPDQIKDKLVDYINLDINGNWQSIMETIEPMMRDVEHEQEADAVATLEAEVGRNGLGVAGVSGTALALTKGQVDTLIMHQNFNAGGGECPNCGTIRPGARPTCPYDGTEMQPIDLREAFTAHAIQQSSTIQIVEASEFLDQNEGVGAILRYRDDVEQAPDTV